MSAARSGDKDDEHPRSEASRDADEYPATYETEDGIVLYDEHNPLAWISAEEDSYVIVGDAGWGQ